MLYLIVSFSPWLNAMKDRYAGFILFVFLYNSVAEVRILKIQSPKMCWHVYGVFFLRSLDKRAKVYPYGSSPNVVFFLKMLSE